MKRLVYIRVNFELINNKHDSELVYPDKPYFAIKACSKFIKYLLSCRLRYIHFSYSYKKEGKLFEETTVTVRDIVEEWQSKNDLPW